MKYEIDKWLNSRSLIPGSDLSEIYQGVDIKSEMEIRPKEVVRHSVSCDKHITIPEEIRESYRQIGRPTPLYRARRLEAHLDTDNKIFFKREDMLPNGSFKINVILPQIYYGKTEGRERAVVETSAGHVGVAAAFASSLYDLKCLVFMTDRSYLKKPYRRYMMELYGAKVLSSPSRFTEIGRQMFTGEIQGSISKASAEVTELVRKDRKSFKVSGSFSDQTLTYNSLVGLEAMSQLEEVTGSRYPDILICCIGGGASFGGLAVPFLSEDDGEMKIIAVESEKVPSLTKGKYVYDYKNASKNGLRIKMFSLGCDFKLSNNYGMGLTFHGASPIVSYFVNEKRIMPVAINEAMKIIAKTEGMVISPESSFAIAQLIREVKTTSKKVILGCITGNGLLDLASLSQDEVKKEG